MTIKYFFPRVVTALILLIGCDNSNDLGNGYKLMTTAAGCRAIGKNITLQTADYTVFGHVFDYANDGNFIIALQIPQDSLLQFPNSAELTWKEMDSLCKNLERKLYFIIDKKNDSTYGSLDKEQYLFIRSNLHISNSLRFKNGS